MNDFSSTFCVEPIEKCPFCGTDCHADFVDNGFGPYSVQCGPYFCEECGASEMGPEKHENDFEHSVTPEEWQKGWYRGDGKVSPYANTVNGVLVDHVTAKAAYELGLLDEKPAVQP